MGAAVEWWKAITFGALLVAAGAITVLVVVLARPARTARVTDDRLLGTWQSDADRTIADIRAQKPVDEGQEAALRKLFGKLRVTYTPATYTTELDGTVETNRYETLGKDKYSVVIREIRSKPSPLDGIVELSEFEVIHFDGPESFWLATPLGPIREYFKRVR